MIKKELYKDIEQRCKPIPLLKDLKAHVFKCTGFIVDLIVKPFDEYMELEEITMRSLDDKKWWFEEFNKTHCKISKLPAYLVEWKGTYEIHKKKDFIEACEDESIGQGARFIQEWMTYENKWTYHHVGIYPKPDMCPKDEYNLWVPFAME